MYKWEFNINQRIKTEGDYVESLFIIKEGSIAYSKEEIRDKSNPQINFNKENINWLDIKILIGILYIDKNIHLKKMKMLLI